MKKFGFLGIDKKVDKVIPEPDFIPIDSDDFERMIFAPDPATGLPCSNLAYIARGDDEVRQYINEHYMNNAGIGDDGIQDPDKVLDLSPGLFETRQEYMDRLVTVISEYQNKIGVNG